MNTISTEITQNAIEGQRYPSYSDPNKLRAFIQDQEIRLSMAVGFSHHRDSIINQLRDLMTTTINNRINSLSISNPILKKRIIDSGSDYLNIYLNYADYYIRIILYSFLADKFVESAIDLSKLPSDFSTVLGISIDMICDDIAVLQETLKSQISSLDISSEIKEECLNYCDLISQWVINNMVKEKIYCQALELFEDEQETQNWLSTPKAKLGNKTPLEALTTIDTAKQVEKMLLQAEYGMIS